MRRRSEDYSKISPKIQEIQSACLRKRLLFHSFNINEKYNGGGKTILNSLIENEPIVESFSLVMDTPIIQKVTAKAESEQTEEELPYDISLWKDGKELHLKQGKQYHILQNFSSYDNDIGTWLEGYCVDDEPDAQNIGWFSAKNVDVIEVEGVQTQNPNKAVTFGTWGLMIDAQYVEPFIASPDMDNIRWCDVSCWDGTAGVDSASLRSDFITRSKVLTFKGDGSDCIRKNNVFSDEANNLLEGKTWDKVFSSDIPLANREGLFNHIIQNPKNYGKVNEEIINEVVGYISASQMKEHAIFVYDSPENHNEHQNPVPTVLIQKMKELDIPVYRVEDVLGKGFQLLSPLSYLNTKKRGLVDPNARNSIINVRGGSKQVKPHLYFKRRTAHNKRRRRKGARRTTRKQSNRSKKCSLHNKSHRCPFFIHATKGVQESKLPK